MRDKLLHINPEDCSDPNKIGLSDLIFEAMQKLPNINSYEFQQIRVPIQKPREIDPNILELNLELMSTNIPIDPMSSCWILLFRKSINREQWEFVSLE